MEYYISENLYGLYVSCMENYICDLITESEMRAIVEGLVAMSENSYMYESVAIDPDDIYLEKFKDTRLGRAIGRGKDKFLASKPGQATVRVWNKTKEVAAKTAEPLEKGADVGSKAVATVVAKPIQTIAELKRKIINKIKPSAQVSTFKAENNEAWSTIAAAFKLGSLVAIDRVFLQWIPPIEFLIFPPIIKKILESEDVVDKKASKVIRPVLKKLREIGIRVKAFIRSLKRFFKSVVGKIVDAEMLRQLEGFKHESMAILNEVGAEANRIPDNAINTSGNNEEAKTTENKPEEKTPEKNEGKTEVLKKETEDKKEKEVKEKPIRRPALTPAMA